MGLPGVTAMPAVQAKAQVFVPSALWATATCFWKMVFVWLPERAAVNVKVYLVPLMVRLPFFVTLELMV